jgi:hypothetical protein
VRFACSWTFARRARRAASTGRPADARTSTPCAARVSHAALVGRQAIGVGPQPPPAPVHRHATKQGVGNASRRGFAWYLQPPTAGRRCCPTWSDFSEPARERPRPPWATMSQMPLRCGMPREIRQLPLAGKLLDAPFRADCHFGRRPNTICGADHLGASPLRPDLVLMLPIVDSGGPG